MYFDTLFFGAWIVATQSENRQPTAPDTLEVVVAIHLLDDVQDNVDNRVRLPDAELRVYRRSEVLQATADASPYRTLGERLLSASISATTFSATRASVATAPSRKAFDIVDA